MEEGLPLNTCQRIVIPTIILLIFSISLLWIGGGIHWEWGAIVVSTSMAFILILIGLM